MDLRHLRYFVAVAEELSFSRAAERLHMAQPPLSVQIRALEDELGAPLFVRDKRRVFLTQAGRAFLEKARDVLASAEQAKTQAKRAADGIVGQLSLGYTASSMFNAVLPRAIRNFQAQHHEVALTFRELGSSAQIDYLQTRQLDVGLVRKAGTPVPSDIRIAPWYTAPLVVAMPFDHRLARKRSVAIADLKAERFIAYPRDAGIGLYWSVIAMCRKAGFNPNIVREALESSSIVGLVAAGAGISVVPSDFSCIQLPGVSYRSLSDLHASSTLYLAYRRDNRDVHLHNLLGILLEHAQTPHRVPK